ncbi:MAG: glycosyltransferase [Candidatus Saccharimonadales bacterium]
MPNTPLVTVVMSVYNDMHYVGRAIESILNQTFRDFEFIIINDGSTDTSREIIESYKDPRITIINQKNHGLVYSLNKGIREAKGAFIARQDSDDASEPIRLQTQVDFLSRHPDTVLIGSSMKVMGEESTVLHTHHVLLGNRELKQELLIRSPFAHGSVMFSKQAATTVGLYDPLAWPAEDYNLWLKLSVQGAFANVNEPLYIYRENSAGISLQNQSKQIQQSSSIRRLAWKKYRSELIPSGFDISIAHYIKLGDDLRVRRIKVNLLQAARFSVLHGYFIISIRLLVSLIKATLERRSFNQQGAK